jgi:hypothetical protein
LASVAPVTRDDAWLTRAIDRYHQLCANPALAGPAVVAEFASAQADAGLTFGGVVQCRSLRPAFITRDGLEQLRSAVGALSSAFAVVEARAPADAALAVELGLSADEQALISIDPGYAGATVVSRLDTYFDLVPRVLEYNADSPAGMSYQAGQAALMQGLPVMERFAEEFELEALRADVALRQTLLAVWSEFARGMGITDRGVPSVAIVDLPGVATSAEFRLVRDDLMAHGVPAIIASPEELTYDGEVLRSGGQRIDLVYKRLLVADFLAHYDLRHPLVRAYADGAVCVASSFRCSIAHKKKALSVLRDPARASWFSVDQHAAIDRLIAETMPYGPAHRTAMEAEQDQWALKPNDAHGGEGVTLGWECDAGGWSVALDRAATGEWVVQERVEPTFGSYPVFDAHAMKRGAQVRRLIEDCNAYLFRGALGGILTRLSETAVINVSQGGQAIPTFVIAPA